MERTEGARGAAQRARRSEPVTLEAVAVNVSSWHRHADEVLSSAKRRSASLICVSETGLGREAIPSAVHRARM
eukprot:9261256-Alexandrium_andersonii.AAC.1